jgi:hypothetical protein
MWAPTDIRVKFAEYRGASGRFRVSARSSGHPVRTTLARRVTVEPAVSQREPRERFMATDTNNLSTDTVSTIREDDVEQGHVTQSAAAPVVVQVPQGTDVVRVQVTPGETIQLPFPIDAVVARLGDNGNLAVKVGNVTVILVGYADATSQAEVNIIGTDARPMDVAAVLASTDPNLDIQTAAGPGAGDAGAGVDNNGGLFSPFDPATGIGGLTAIGGLDPTALNYNLIQRDFVELIEEDATEANSVPIVIETVGGIVNEDDLTSNYGNVLDGGQYNDYLPAIDGPQALVQDIINEFCWNPVNGNDRYDDADYDGEDTKSGTPFGDAIIGYDPNGGDSAPADFDREPLVFNGTATVDFGADAPGTLVFNADTLTQLTALGLKSGGFDLQYQQIDDTHIQGYIFDGECYVLVFTVAIGDSYPNPTGPGTTFDIFFILSDNLDHPLPVGVDADETNLLVPVFFQAIDNGGSTAGGQITFGVRDDIPVIDNENLDESSSLLHPALYLDDDDLKGGNPGGIGDDDSTANYNLSGYLGVRYGADGPGSLLLTDPSLPEGFSASLSLDGLTLLIKQNGVDVLKITLNDSTSGYLTVEQLAAIDHPEGDDENNLQFTINFEATDFDGDKVGGSISIDVDDDTPVAGWNCTVHLDDDALLGGNPGGIGDNVDSAHATGTLAHSYGADGAGTLLLTAATLPAGFTQDVSTDGLTLTILQNGTPVLKIELSNDTDGIYTVTQLAPIQHEPGADENNVQFTISYEVTDGDGDPVSGSLTIDVDDDTPVTSWNCTVRLDDDALTGGNPGGTGDDIDAAHVTGTLAHSFGADGAGTTLLTAATLPGVGGFTQDVSPDGLTVTISQNGAPVLKIELSNAIDGAYTVTQLAAISHPDGLAENNVQFTVNYEVTDKDGDTANGSMVIDVDDDSPIVSENNGVQLDDDALGGIAGGTGDDDDGVNVTGTFGHSYGADGAGTTLLTAATLPGVGGFTQLLSPDGLTLTISQNGTPVLKIELTNAADGSYAVTQLAAISHPEGGDENNVQFIVNYQVTDKDGDIANGSMIVDVDDDTPTVSANNQVQLDDDAKAGGNAGGTGDVDPDTANTTGTLAHNYGADGAGTTLLTAATLPGVGGFTQLVAPDGLSMTIFQNGTPVLLVTLTNPVDGSYTVTQLAAISHPAGFDENNVQFTVNYQVTDKDGDTANGSMVIDVDDDTPTVSANSLVQLDDDALGGNPGGTGDDPDAGPLTFGQLAHSYGADGAGSIAFLTTGAPIGFTYVPLGPGLLVLQDGVPVMQVFLTDPVNGDYFIQQWAPITHPLGGDENNIQLTFDYRVTDKDGDFVDGTLTVDVDDDTPTVSANSLVQLDDDAKAGGNAGGVGDVNPDTAKTTGILAYNYGADGAGTTLLTAATLPGVGGFTQVVAPNGLSVIISQNGTPVLKIELSNTTGGSYTVTQLAAISHPAGLDENNVQFTVNYQVTDKDGDSANGSMVIDVDDDTPTVSANSLVQLDDDAKAGGNAGGTGDDADAVNVTGTLAHSYGADGAGTTLLTAATLPGVGGFTQVVSPDGLTVTISQNGTPVLKIELTDTTGGSYTVTQLAAISHPAGLDENNVQFTVNYQVTDKDGDTANGSMIVDVDDDTPTATNDAGGTVDTGATVSANTVGAGVAGNDSFGADGAKSGGGVVGVLAGNGTTQTTSGVNTQIVTALGTLTLQANGTYSYTAKSNVSGTDYFTYTIEDGDGDRTTAVLSFNVADQAQGTITGSTWVYEDGQPGQNTGDLTTATSALGIAFTPSDNEVVTSLTLQNLPTGWKIYDGNTLLGTGNGTNFVIDITLHALTNLKILPPTDNADSDLTLNISATIQDPNGGLTNTINGLLTIGRDGVADKPTAVTIAVTDAGANGLFSIGEAGVVNIKATFGDAADASETHSLVFKVPAGFNLTDWNGSTWVGLPAGITVISVTGSSGAGWTVTFGVADNKSSVDFNVNIVNTAAVASNAQFTIDAKTLEEATVAGPNGNGSGNELTVANNTAITSASVPVVSARVLNGALVTNTPSAQQGDQAMILTFVQDGQPLNAYSQVVVRDTQGQQGAVLADSGFNIDPSKNFNVALENPLEGHKIIVTDFTLEGVTLDVSGGNIQIEHEDSSGKAMGVYAQMSPNAGGTVIVGESIDGDSGNNTVPGTTGQNYLYGGSGNDTLNGGNEDDVLNGGVGNDTLNGDAGNDVLVWNGGLQTAAGNTALGDHYHGGEGFDLLRVDQGALYNSTIGNKANIDFFPDQASDTTVDLRGAHIDGMEGILITEEAVISGANQSGTDALGTKILLNASDVFNFSETDTLYVIGSKGDSVDLDNLSGSNVGTANWVAGGDVTPIAGGVTFTQYTGTFSDVNGSHSVTLYVDKDVTVV